MGNNADRTRPSQSPGWGAVFFEFRVKDLITQSSSGELIGPTRA
jgi:hypothetical protein